MRLRNFVPLVALLVVSSATANEAQTIAPPKTQDEIFLVFNNMAATCKGPLTHAKVLSSELQPGAKVEERKLVSGEVREVWQATPCGHRIPVKYLFRLTPGKDGEVRVFGFEPMR